MHPYVVYDLVIFSNTSTRPSCTSLYGAHQPPHGYYTPRALRIAPVLRLRSGGRSAVMRCATGKPTRGRGRPREVRRRSRRAHRGARLPELVRVL